MIIKDRAREPVGFGLVQPGEVFKCAPNGREFYIKISEGGVSLPNGTHNCVELRSGKTAVCTIDSKVYVYKNATLELNE